MVVHGKTPNGQWLGGSNTTPTRSGGLQRAGRRDCHRLGRGGTVYHLAVVQIAAAPAASAIPAAAPATLDQSAAAAQDERAGEGFLFRGTRTDQDGRPAIAAALHELPAALHELPATRRAAVAVLAAASVAHESTLGYEHNEQHARLRHQHQRLHGHQ